MQLFRSYHFSPEPLALTIGNFDGMHLGHQAMLTQLKAQAAARKLPVAVVLFEPQPAEFFQADKAPARLFSLRQKLEALRDCGVDYVFCLKFDPVLATMPATEFINEVLFARLKAQYLLVGQDFRFGHQRQGDYRLLAEQSEKAGVSLDSFADYAHSGLRVSSSRIRQALQQGDFSQVNTWLGRPYRLCGRVLHGAKLAREWGIPTANIAVRHQQLPLRGVFQVKVLRENGSCHPGVANLGTRPTVDGSKAFLETHLLNFSSSLYGERLQIEFLHKERDEIKFPSVDALFAQIRCDLESSYAFFAASPLLINEEK
ncbi:MAG: bifunctional riboflavin kinase/FAD synthetase [Legionellaceae bacterium]|nr:bifunctional riboflavin kinase/FAD synthetase [Legionellaceae bacterium]